MTKQEAAIIMAFTGNTMLTGDDFSIFHKYIENKLKRPVWTHELGSDVVWEQIKEASKEDFINLCKSLKNETNAQWELVRYDPDYLVFSGTCTGCKQKHESTDNVGKLPFCPHCGAAMQGERVPKLISAEEE